MSLPHCYWSLAAAQASLYDGHVALGRTERNRPTGREILGRQAVVFPFADLSAVSTKIIIAAALRDDGLPAGAVLSIAGNVVT
jgi:hypothetical protein